MVEMDKSILMQKQVKDNSEDLQKEFFDLRNWEEEMKRKDEELRKETSEQIPIPPIRSKHKNKTKSVSTKPIENNKSKRIKSYDYSAWDKFDVDKACKDMDRYEHSDSSGDEAMSKEKLENMHEIATKHKNEGNIFVQQQKWAEAIGCYNQAIKAFPYDAVFYANRALCHLKLDNFYSAESDCCSAIQLDGTYVKAYHRRATARMNLKQYKEAEQDLETILKLEPSNKEAKLMLIQIKDKNKIADSVNTLKANLKEMSETSKLEKKIDEKMCSSASGIKRTEIKDLKDNKHSTEDKKKSRNLKDLESSKEEKSHDIGDNITKKEEKYLCIPDWLPEKNDVVVIDPIERPPHLRSKKSLTRIPVEEVDFAAIQYNNSNKKIISNEDQLVEPEQSTKDDDFKKNNESIKVSNSSVNIDLPPVPKTAVQFITQWKTNKSSEFRYMYLKQLPKNCLPKIFQDSMESDIFTDIIEVLKIEFTKRKESVFCYLKDLSEVKRFRALIMFISTSEKESLRVLFKYCKTIEDISQEEITALQKKYEI
ncbi:RNA polymerase II-associated protein spaghetti [Calliopsis andreniformis]|uniref:RNA polymerase II-associated protein spaghetti n=1 Tax=Calliopsis andreniformis TaxID=337506 RepID=UPI003FCD5FA2